MPACLNVQRSLHADMKDPDDLYSELKFPIVDNVPLDWKPAVPESNARTIFAKHRCLSQLLESGSQGINIVLSPISSPLRM